MTLLTNSKCFPCVSELPVKREYPVPLELIKKCCEFFKMDIKDLVTKNRQTEVRMPRQIIMAILYHNTKWSVTQIGRYFKRDHTTVCWAKKVVKNQLETDDSFRAEYYKLKDFLFNKST